MVPKSPVPQSKFLSILTVMVMTSLLLMSCGLPSQPLAATSVPPSPTTPVVLSSPTFIPPSPTPVTLPATDTPIPPSPTLQPPTATAAPILPSATPLVPTTPQTPMGNFSLAPGTTVGSVGGPIQPGQVITYTLGAVQSQALTLILESPNKDVTLGVLEPNGNKLLDPALKARFWNTVLPTTEIYTLQVIGGTAPENYSLTIKTPQLVSFAAGATSIVLSGTTANGYFYSYAVAGGAGQTLTVNLSTPSSTAYFDVYDTSGDNLLDTSVKATTWTGFLPQTQDYVIEVVPVNNQVVSYSLTISLTGQASNLGSGGSIAMAPGTTAAVIKGAVQAGQIVTYTVQAGAAQPMILEVESPNKDVTLGVLEPNGNVLLNPANKWTNWQSQLPTTEQYTIQVIGGAASDTFVLTVKIGQLVYFAEGSHTVTLKGNTYPGYVVSYAFRLGAGETLTATVSAPAGMAHLDIFGIATGALVTVRDALNTWTGKLPQTQEYVVEVVPEGGASFLYTLTVTAHY